MMAEIERILENKPTRPPMVSTLALRWQSMCPPGSNRYIILFGISNKYRKLYFFSGGQGGTSNAESPKDDEYSNTEMESKDSQKMPFCEIQWQKVSEFVKTRKIKTPDEKPLKEKVRWSYSPDEGPKCTYEPFLTGSGGSKKREKKTAASPVQVWDKIRPDEVLI